MLIKKGGIMKRMFLMLLVVVSMFSMIVSVRADDASVLCNNPQDMRICLGVTEMEMTPPADWAYCSRYDFNSDGIINLVDVPYLARMCYEEPVHEGVKEKSVRSFSKSGSSTYVKYESDGSVTFRSVGTVVQYPGSNMIIKYPRGYVNTFCWYWLPSGVDYCATPYRQFGYNFLNVVEV